MRTNDERIKALHIRAEAIKKERKERTLEIVAVGAALLSVILLAMFMPRVSTVPDETALTGMNASIFASSEVLNLIIVAVISFALGAAVTIFCYCIRGRTERQDVYDRKDR
ncbi:MAG: hypothetical protein IKF68_01625 [Erysipelotrichaceae bacterium]|nr:hypothetical protein [Erysipelotrichaceae bacterium]